MSTYIVDSVKQNFVRSITSNIVPINACLYYFLLYLVFPNVFKEDVSAATGYAGGAIRMSVDASNFIPFPQIGWHYRGKPSIRNNDPRFTVLPQGVLQIYGLTSADGGEIQAIARSRSSDTKNVQTFTGKYASLSIKSS